MESAGGSVRTNDDIINIFKLNTNKEVKLVIYIMSESNASLIILLKFIIK